LFFGGGNRDLDLGTKELTVTSQHGAGFTTIMYCNSHDEVSYKHQGFLIRGHQTSATVIENVTIQGASDTALHGGAIDCVGSSPLIRHVDFGWGAGGARGLSLFTWLGAPVIQDCSFKGVRGANGAVYCKQSSLRVEHCTFDECAENGFSGVVELYG